MKVADLREQGRKAWLSHAFRADPPTPRAA